MLIGNFELNLKPLTKSNKHMAILKQADKFKSFVTWMTIKVLSELSCVTVILYTAPHWSEHLEKIDLAATFSLSKRWSTSDWLWEKQNQCELSYVYWD